MRPIAVVFVVLLATVTGAGTEPDAPLAGTRDELKQLRSTPTGRSAAESGESLKGGMPALTLPSSSAPISLRPTPETRDNQRRSQAAQNWLLNGVDRLEKESDPKRSKGDRTGKHPDETDLVVLDPSDPDFLLKVYERQKQTAETKAAKEHAPASTRPDAFAPFLQEWMADSPVKNQLLKNRAHLLTDGSASSGVSTPVMSSVRADQPVGGDPAISQPFQLGVTAPTNPYLTAADPAGSGAAKESVVDLGANSVSPALPTATLPAPVTAPLYLPAPVPAPPVRNAPSAPLADDKKYFPQLKKF